MVEQILIIITNTLESFQALFENIKNSLGLKIIIVEAGKLISGTLNTELVKCRISEIILAIDNEYFKEHEMEIRDYFKSLFDAPFTNILQLYRNIDIYKKTLLKKKAENAFMLFSDFDIEKVTIYFYMYLNDLYAKAKIAYRLSDYIYQSFKGVVNAELLKIKNQEVEMLNKELERRNRIDPLTNLFNRKALFEFLDRERNRSVRNLLKIGIFDPEGDNHNYKDKDKMHSFSTEYIEGNLIIFSIMMIDLDKFKYINDTYGHLVGDSVLKTLGHIFLKDGVLREQDIAGRFGGEEFIVILPGTNALHAIGPAMRLTKELDKYAFKGNDEQEFKVTMSIGISEYRPADKTGEEIIQRADKALYTAKGMGRNRIIVYEDAQPGLPGQEFQQ